MPRRVWIWNSPDGTMVFGTAKRAREYSEYCTSAAVTWKHDPTNDHWRAFAEGNDDEYEPDISIYPEEIR